ncbi:uncharacterized protein LOC121289904 [Carcharodon carcharias]|uniref:uncharacterized protein LOC121289904 n=1 Tax=Carcharodon carcharias TaxID=13397 RepID=UPI001B7F0A6E|nr:uncharacterized protein LOC121289904 [Carcharodon carcharias]
MAMILFVQQIFLVFSVTLWQYTLVESLTLSQYPTTIEKKTGESAEIHCKLSNGNATEDLRLVWYRYIDQNRLKIGEINLKTNNTTAVDHVVLQWSLGNHTASMSIKHLMKNNSGTYGCELFRLSGNLLGIDIINKANATNITVTEQQIPTPGSRNNTDNMTEEFQDNGARIQIIVAAVIAAFVIICLLIYILFRYRPKKQGTDASPPAADVSCQKAEDPISTVFSMDYAVLKIPGKIDRQNLASSISSDDSYYATIVFAHQEQATSVQKTTINN